MAKEEREIMAINVDMSCDGECQACERFFECELPQKEKVYKRARVAKALQVMAGIKHKIAVIAGKGGVGKSVVSANLATALAMRGRRVTILDHDFDGPCIPKMMGVTGEKLYITKKGIEPVKGLLGMGVVSTGLLLQDDEAMTWFHDLRRSATEEFLAHVNYGDIDYLVLDLPPGTSSDSVNMMTYIPDLDGAVIVTIPAEVSQIVAKKATLLCQKAKVKVLGIIENMSGYVCPDCGENFHIFHEGGGERLAKELGVPFLGCIPIDPEISFGSDTGKPFVYTSPDSPSSRALTEITGLIEKAVGWQQ